MFDFDAGKLLIIGVVALIVIGPKELPRVLRQVGQMVGRVRRMAAEFQGQFMDAMKEADIQSIRDDLKKIGDEADAHLKTNFDPARDIQRELTSSLEKTEAAEAVPALAEVPSGATDGFALPPPETPAAADEREPAVSAPSPAIGDAGAVPIVLDPPPIDHAAVSNGAGADLKRAAKRKIIVRKRGPLIASRTHEVSDRTLSARVRPQRPRGQEAAER